MIESNKKSIIKYETVKLRADHNNSGALKQWLLSRNHGQWGNETEGIAIADEPQRTQHYLRTGHFPGLYTSACTLPTPVKTMPVNNQCCTL